MKRKREPQATKWSDDYKTEFGFLKSVESNCGKAFCTICNSEFSISHGGRADIVKHCATDKHSSGIKASSNSVKLTDYFKNLQHHDENKVIAAKEAAWAYHTARHNISLRTSDCSGALIRHLFDVKFSMARNKTSAIINNVISPFIESEVDKKLNELTFVTLITDTSNRLNIKMLPIIARGFSPKEGVVNFKIALTTIPNEKSSTLAQELVQVLDAKDLKNKMVAFGADNTNLNFGGRDRKGKENVWRKLQAQLGREILGLGCGAHITHNAIDAGCEMLDTNFEALVVNIHKHFRIHTTRNETLKEHCVLFDKVYQGMKSHSGTRFLSLNPAIQRILSMFEPLRSYFDELEKRPPWTEFFFDNKAKFWLFFIENQTSRFNDSIKIMERATTTSFQAAEEMNMLRKKVQNRLQLKYLPADAESEFNNLPEVDQTKIHKDISKFYSTIIDYIENWDKSFDGSRAFDWMSMTRFPDWSTVKNSFDFAVSRFGDKFRELVNRDQICDEFGLMKEFCEQNISDWRTNRTPCSEIWQQIFKEMSEQQTQLVNMEKLVEFAFCLPGTSTEVERVFSLINNIWDDNKSHMKIETVGNYLSIQYNSNLNCTEFYDNVKSNKQFLEKVSNSDKYKK